VTAVLSSLIGAATGVWQVAVFRVGAWTARGIRVPARNALLADVVPPSAYGRAYGFERSMDNLGAIFGPLLALALVAMVGVRTAILVSVIPGLLAAFAIVYAIRSAPTLATRERPPLRIRVRPVLQGELRPLFVGFTAFEVGNVAATLLILRATELLTPGHGHDRAVEIALVLYAGYNLAATLVSVPAGHVSDKRGTRGVLTAGAAAFLLAYLGFAVVGASIARLAISFAVAGVGIGCTETVEHAAVATLAPESIRGSAFGLLASVQAFGNLAASAVAGALWTWASPQVAFAYLAAWMVVAVVVFLAGGRAR
jgi:MFS family permease